MSSERMDPKMTEVTEPNDRLPAFGILGRVLSSLFVVFVLVAGVGGWAAIAELSGAVIAQGAVVVDGRAKRIQHREGGIVSAINVKDGDRVAQGDVLITLDSTQVKAEFTIITSQLVELRARQARLIAESRSDDEIAFPSDLIADEQARPVISGERRLFENARSTRQSQKEQLALRISQLQKEIDGVGAQRSAKGKELSLIEKELGDLRQLFERKLTSATRIYALEREQARLSGEHGNLVAQGARLEGQVSEIRLQIINIDQAAHTDAQRDLRNVEARIAELKEREAAQKDRLIRMDIRAPQNGIVHELQAHTVGGVITPAEPVMTIVPDDQMLTVEVRIPPAEIDQVHVGQPVRLRFTAFNQRTTPEKPGTVSFVSADTTRDAKTRIDYYLATVSLDRGEAFSVGQHPIVPGMPVDAFITTGSRTALSYFVKPLSDHLSRALRED